MKEPALKQQVTALLALAGVRVNGTNPWDLQVHDARFYKRVLRDGTLGLGEAYMDGWWDCERIDEFAFQVLRADLYKKASLSWKTVLEMILAKLLNLQAKGKATQNARRHYDISNKLYQCMLDKRLNYSCGYWRNTDSLDVAQENKLDLICRKLRLQAGQTVLDIGCGWGGFAKFAAEKYGAIVTGITVSEAQISIGREMCKGLPVELRLQDYRDVNEQFDHVVSVGMVEHVGYKNHRKFMEVAARCLKPEGLFLLHTIGQNFSRTSADPFTDTYIFPNCVIPSMKQLSGAMEHLFVIEDVHNFGPDYDRTLQAWFRNFEAYWPALKAGFDERFYRMWKYYLLSSAGSFRARQNQLWQLVLSKKGVLGGYEAVR